jgi:fermentation-respiration switch protein FrsA (DUF1100 family)
VLVTPLALAALTGYVVLVGLAWLFQERLAFPAPRHPLPDSVHTGVVGAQIVSLVMPDGTRLAGWYLPPSPTAPSPAPPSPALLWFYGNGETIGTIWPVLRDFQPPGVALLVVDYPGYGASGGRASEAGLYAAAQVAYDALLARPEIDRTRVFLYGRSLGSAVATHLAAHRPVAGLVLESPFTSARGMSRRHYALVPSFLLRLRLDNLATMRRLRCPVLVFHGTADRLVPVAMGERVAAAAPGPAELVLIPGADHNETYARGGRAYRDRLWRFVAGHTAGRDTPSHHLKAR